MTKTAWLSYEAIMYDQSLLERSYEYLVRVKEVYGDQPEFASDVGLNGVNYLIKDLEKRLDKAAA